MRYAAFASLVLVTRFLMIPQIPNIAWIEPSIPRVLPSPFQRSRINICKIPTLSLDEISCVPN